MKPFCLRYLIISRGVIGIFCSPFPITSASYHVMIRMSILGHTKKNMGSCKNVTYPLKDIYGNVTEEIVIKATFLL